MLECYTFCREALHLYLHTCFFVVISEELLQPLTDYISRTSPDGIVRQVRTEKREGLIAARQIGAAAANGDVMVFLDAHCEVTKGW